VEAAPGLTWSPEAHGRTNYALEVGVGTPRAGISGGYAFALALRAYAGEGI